MTTREIRKRFLTRFFGLLEAGGVRYCLLRNYDDLYGNPTTDLDMIVATPALRGFEQCLQQAAAETDYHFVHAARYVNFSRVFWHPLAGFIRVDYETDVRWRLFTVLDAPAVLDRCRRHEEFFIPHPEHEIAILYVAALWRGELSERYRAQLGRLYAACPDQSSLRQSLVGAFGPAGRSLTDLAAAAASVLDRRFITQLRWNLALRGQLLSPRCLCVVKNLWADVFRLWGRLRRAAGASLFYVTSQPVPPDFTTLVAELDFLFPIKKHRIEAIDLRAPGQSAWNWQRRWRRARTMFKGGLFIGVCQVAEDADIPRVLRSQPRQIYVGRTFVCGSDRSGRRYFGHAQSGFMISAEDRTGEGRMLSQSFIEFAGTVFERTLASSPQGQLPRRGLFCVLAGLDGSGKTTLGRNLCNPAVAGQRFAGVRYFHWRPKAFRAIEWPLPDYRETPRKPPLPRHLINTLLSFARIARNGALVRIAWHLQVRPLMRRGYLVLVDRYFYNYHLDPASVKFSAPAGLLKAMEKLFPPPDLVVKLHAPKEVLLARKQELSPREIEQQIDRLNSLAVGSARVVTADATQPADLVALQVMGEIAGSNPRS